MPSSARDKSDWKSIFATSAKCVNKIACISFPKGENWMGQNHYLRDDQQQEQQYLIIPQRNNIRHISFETSKWGISCLQQS